MTTTTFAAASYADHDDCLSACAESLVREYPDLDGYDLSPRWASEERDEILVDLPRGHQALPECLRRG